MHKSPALRGNVHIGYGESPLPVDDFLPPPEGKGELTTGVYGLPPHEDFPEGTTALELLNWSNYRDRPFPKLFPSPEENQKMWHEIDLDRMLDYHPAHEIHPSKLPDYHYWPMICNDFHPPLKKSFLDQHTWDRTDIPRFHKNGIPKTLPQEQCYYVAPKADGRFDWKRNAIYNSRQVIAYCSEEGWNARYLRRIFRPWLGGRQGSRQAGVHMPIYWKHRELPVHKRMFRWLKGSYIVTGFVYLPFYCAGLAYLGSTLADYDNLYWPGDGPANPDIRVISQLGRNKGAYHDFV